MAESQNIEWKESWRDEYLKWICGFANAQGGRIYIGTDDHGTVIGVSDSKRLLEDIPNKVRDILGIIVDVNLLMEDGKEYIEICVNPSSYPVNFKGEYHYRSGSTKQLLRGAALTEFLLSKTGYKWDAVYISNDCVFPVGWTIETLMERHRSVPYNPNIANVFFMQSKVPEKSDDTLDGTLSGTLEEKILLVIKENPEATQAKLALKVGCSERTVKRIMKEMVKNNIIERVGGRKMGKWVEKRKY